MTQHEENTLKRMIVELEMYARTLPPGEIWKMPFADSVGRIPPGTRPPLKLMIILGKISDGLAHTTGDESNRIKGLHALCQFMLSWGSDRDEKYGAAITFKRSDLVTLAETLRELFPV